MINAILGIKKGMSQAWSEDGRRIPTTLIQAGPLVVTQIKAHDRDGYEAVQLGLGERKIKNISKAVLGHLKGATKGEKVAPRFLREIKQPAEDLKVGDEVKASDVISPGDLVKVIGISKGKGFAGVVRRYHFAGGPRTHGQSDRERAPGSIGQTTTPGRVYKGKRMAGRMGSDRVTIRNLVVLSVKDNGEVLLSGPVPGNKDSLVTITKIGQIKDFSPLVVRGQDIKPEELPPMEVEVEAEQAEAASAADSGEPKEEKKEE
ncbi:50S ribosomal protein L3 [Candidatus Microgenomates bacterium]|nr:50S ribosomal protein L3 [Candidatus Microgenomates bacterium]